MHKESGLCYEILKIMQVWESMMFALKNWNMLEKWLEKCLKMEFLGKSLNFIGNQKFALENEFSGKFELWKIDFEDLELLFWGNGFENSEKIKKFIGKWLLKWKMDSQENSQEDFWENRFLKTWDFEIWEF